MSWYCGADFDDVNHTLFVCDAWHTQCTRASTIIGIDKTPATVTNMMLKSKENWIAISNFVHAILTKKEEEERRRQLQT